jgi:HD-GYP domain-containing protein (c-di-GMP phosphodiesterase class II)
VLEDEQVMWIRSHHERWDGAGYPDALHAETLPDGAQLLAIADAYDVMTQTRTYKAPRTPADALEECQRQAGQPFAAQAVEAMFALQATSVA